MTTTDSKEREAFKAWHRQHGDNTQGIAWVDALLWKCWQGRASLATSADGCQHESDGFTYTSIPPKNRCKKCGAVYTLGGPQAASAGSEPTKYVNELLRTALLELMKAEDRAENLSFAADKFARDSARFAMNDAMERARKAIAYVPENPQHDSDCSLHNEPAFPAGPCDCSVSATHPFPPEGMVMVPREPTMAMRIAAKTADMDHTNLSDWMVSDWPEFKRIWDAMLEAAPPTSSADSRKGE